MSETLGPAGEQGLRFFGSVSASISHEIKNCLAILTENAGLLEDLVLMIEQGHPFDAERLKALAGRIQKQVKRADGIVGKMNRFAHTVDEGRSRVDLDEVLCFSVSLADRMAILKGVELSVRPCPEPLPLETSPFLLSALIWGCLSRALGEAGRGNGLELSAEPLQQGARIQIRPRQGWSLSEERTGITRGERALIAALGAQMEIDPESGAAALTLPSTSPPETRPDKIEHNDNRFIS